MLLGLAGVTALAALPDGLYPMAVPWDTPTAYAAWRAGQGLPPVTLVCEETWPRELRICVRRVVDGRREWVSETDLMAWGVRADEVWKHLRDASLPRLDEVETRAIDDMPVSYLVVRDGLGWAAGGLWHAAMLAGRLKVARVHVAMPTDGLLMAWATGDPGADKVLATAVTQLFEQGGSKHGVTAVVHTWTGTQWVQFAEAKRQP